MNHRKAIVLTAGYLLCQIVADVTAAKIVGPILGQFIPAAVFIYAVTFTWRDLVHRHLGKQASVILVWTAAVVNVLMAAYFVFTVALPPAPFWPNQEAYAMVLGIVPRIVIASIIAEIASELVDTEIYHTLLSQPHWIGVGVSNGISLILDSLIFCSLAFLGTMPLIAVGQIVWGQILVKATITVLSIPLLYVVRGQPWVFASTVG